MERREPTKAEHTISVYCDESITDEVVVCAAAVFTLEKVATAETALISMKTGLGLSPDVPLHCRIIFNGNARRATPWESIPPEAIHSSIENLCGSLVDVGLRPLVFVAEPSPLFIPGPPGAESKSTSLDVKGQAAMGFQAVSFHLARMHGFGAFRMWVDPDTTKIAWLGARMQANSTRSGYMDLGPDIEPPLFESLIKGYPKPRLLEIADLYAYVAARAHSTRGGWKNRWFQKLYSVINPERLVWQHTNQDVKWVSASTGRKEATDG